MSRNVRVLPAAALLLCAPFAQAAPRPWIEVKSPRFTVVSDAGEKSAREVAWQFEQARAAYGRLWSWGRVRGGKPFLVLAARDEASLKALAPQYWEDKRNGTVSASVSGPDRHYLALRLDTNPADDVRATPYFNLYRVYVKSVLDSAFDRPLPLWLRVGLGEAYANTRVRDKEVMVAMVVPWHINRLREGRRIPLPDLLAAGGRSPLLAGNEIHLYYAQSWALVHYLLFAEKGALVPRLNRFVDLVQQGRAHDAALRESLGDVAALDKGLDSYLFQVALPYARVAVDVNVRSEAFPVRTLGPAESAAVRAGFHVAMRRPREARALIDEAKATGPALAAGYEAEALLLDGEEADAAALAAYQKAAELGSSSFYTHYRMAQLLHRTAPPGDKEVFARIAKSLERSVDLNPEYASGHSYLAEVKSYLGDSERALVMARTALALEPGGSYHHSALANVLLDLGKPEEAMEAARRALALADEDWERRNAEKTIEEIRGKSPR
jgi:tetratricopeptide (TPR) repeat protein